MKRGDLWTISGGPDYAGKPRPGLVVQDDRFETDSVTIAPFTTDSTSAPLFRLEIQSSDANGLRAMSRVMVDKITTVPRSKLGSRVGRLSDADLVRVNRAIVVFLGIAS